MGRLGTLVDGHIRELTGVEFKIAVHLYRRLERKAANRVLEIKIADIARATGVSPRQRWTSSQSDAGKESMAKKEDSEPANRHRLQPAKTADKVAVNRNVGQ
jgi:hypothetical protein